MDFILDLLRHLVIPITKPASYGLFHILFCVITIVAFILICYFTRKCSDKTFRIIILSVGAFLIIAEIYKHLYFAFLYNVDGTQTIKYEWDIFSFQLCSVPMYLCIPVGLLKKGKVRDVLCEYLVTIGFLGGIMAYLEPSGILHDDLFRLLHSCIWHSLLIFIALFILFTNNACTNLKHFKRSLIVFYSVVCLATIFNLAFYSKVDEGFNMCYISPFINTPLAVFKQITEYLQIHLGEYVGRIIVNALYVLVVPIGGLIIYIIEYFVKKLFNKNKKVVEETEIIAQ